MPNESNYASYPTYYVGIYTAGAQYAELSEACERLQDEHVAYQIQNQELGKLVLGGPFIGEFGGMTMFRGSTREEIEAIIAADPGVIGGLYKVELREYKLVLDSLPR